MFFGVVVCIDLFIYLVIKLFNIFLLSVYCALVLRFWGGRVYSVRGIIVFSFVGFR